MIFEQFSQYGPVLNTQTSEISDIRNLTFKYLGLYFTADWCSGCARTSSALKKIVQKINQVHPDALKLITIRLDQTKSQFGYYYWKFPKLNLQYAQQISNMLQVRYLPSVYIFNSKGYLVSAGGFSDIFNHRQKTIQYWDKLAQGH